VRTEVLARKGQKVKCLEVFTTYVRNLSQRCAWDFRVFLPKSFKSSSRRNECRLNGSISGVLCAKHLIIIERFDPIVVFLS
jgi:hypothetical protein